MKTLKIRLKADGTIQTMGNIKMFEGESGSILHFSLPTRITSDKYTIMFKDNRGIPYVYPLEFIEGQGKFQFPREFSNKGKLDYTITELNGMFTSKWAGLIFINSAGDITDDVMTHRPDVFAIINIKIEQLEQHIKDLTAEVRDKI